ncbi:MAG: glycosyltransferase family 4 protein [Tannerellaceae bacterium]
MNILITTPSLDLVENVSGISSITRLLIQYNKGESYFPFILGKKDNDRRGVLWLFSLFKIPFRLCAFIIKHQITAAHFNIGFEPRSLLRDVIPYLILVNKKMPLFLHIHGGRYMATMPTNLILKFVISIFLKKATRIIVLSNTEATYLCQHYSCVIKGKLEIVSNAVEIPEDKDLDKCYEGVLNILYLGRIDEKKGLRFIAETLNKLSDMKILFQFYLCGTGPDKDRFIKLLNKKVYSSIIDMGLVYGKEKKRILKLAHLFLLPSFFEGLPMALLESMGYAVCPLVSQVGSMPDVVKNGESGLFVSDSDSIVSAISLLNEDRESLKRMAQASHETIKNRFSISQYIDQINTVYLKI